LVATFRAPPVAWLVMLIEAPGMNAPRGSVTVPKMVPVGVCAYPVALSAAATHIDRDRSRAIFPSS
jgi:hypothetical protein